MVAAHLNGNAEIVMTEISSIGAINDTDIVNTTSDLQKDLVHYCTLSLSDIWVTRQIIITNTAKEVSVENLG